MDWTAILGDGREFSDADGGPDDVPRWPRVVTIAQPCASDGWRNVLVNGDVYIWRNDIGCWTEHTDQGALLEMVDHAADIGAVRFGKYVSRPTFEALWQRARELNENG